MYLRSILWMLVFVLFKIRRRTSFSYFFHFWDLKLNLNFISPMLRLSISFVIWLVHLWRHSSGSSEKCLYMIDWLIMKGFSKRACVCYISVNDCTGLVIHHAVFVVCHSLILSPEFYSGSLVFLHGVFQGTSSTVSVAVSLGILGMWLCRGV